MKDDKMRKVQFVHVRQVDEDGQVQPKGGMTYCYVPFVKENDHFSGYAFCSQNDLFSKSRGRYKAQGRAHSLRNSTFGLMTMEKVTAEALSIAEEKDSVLAKRFKRPRMLLEVYPKYKGKRD